MPYQLITLETAAKDIVEAYNYYEKIQEGLGDRFLGEVLERYNRLNKHPQYYGFIDDQHKIRDVMLRSFPYQIVYENENENVIIYSVHNCSRNPEKRFTKR